MSKGISVFISFLVGASIGVSASYFVLKDKYEKEKDEFYEKEVKPARDAYFQKQKELDDKSKEMIDANRKAKEKISETYNDLNRALGYATDEQAEVSNDEEKLEDDDHLPPIPDPVDINGPDPYFISSDDFVDDNNYEKDSFVYHSNKIVIDEDYNPIDDFEDMVGKENFEKLDQLLNDGSDIVWIRNDNLEKDFEIQLADYDFND